MTHIGHSGKVFVMRVFLAVLVLIFSLQSWAKADDINEFEIEGMSIGDSLLKKYTKNELEEFRKADYYKNDEYTTIESIRLPNDSMYEYLSYSYKTNDKNYTLVHLVADIDYIDNIDECYPAKDKIVEELKPIFINSDQVDNGIVIHPIDKSGKSKISLFNFYPKNGGSIAVACYDYSKETGYPDVLRISFSTDKFLTWINTKAYN